MPSASFNMLAKTYHGLEDILASELRELGAQDIKTLYRAVSFKGDTELMYKANYYLRTAVRVLKPFAIFSMENEDDLYHGIRSLDWFGLVKTEGSIAVDATLVKTSLNHSRYVEQKVKDAIVDLFRDKYSLRPSVDLNNPDLRINIYIEGNQCSVALDSSGVSLHKRGWRVRLHQAYISEILAAGMLMLSGWDKKTDLFDPMCGSGTLLIEAAMMATNLPAGFYRESFGFEKWPDFNRHLWKQIKEEALDLQSEPEGTITGCDKSIRSIEMAEENIRFAKMHHDIKVHHSDFEKFPKPFDTGFIITNPPYDERLKVEDNTELYSMIGDTLKKSYSGSTAWIISADMLAMKSIGLKPSKKIHLMNGALACRFHGYDLFKGTHKEMKQSKI
jgi:putative N6-adenine-specific DNA methylase